MADRPDYYALLGVHRDDPELAIRAAYRRLVLKHHPDRHPDDPDAAARLRNLVEAYETLGDPAARERYDAGHQPPQGPQTGPVEELLGRVVDAFVSVRDARDVAGRDHQYRLTLSFGEAARGGTRVLNLPVWRTCGACEGRGFPLEALPTICEACEGAGAREVRKTLRRVIEACQECAGRGYIVTNACLACSGDGVVEARREVSIDIPAGVTSTSRLVVRGAGQAGTRGGADGDCYVLITVDSHPIFSRSGDDVVMSRPVSLLKAICGGWVSVPTLDGVKRLRLPPKSQDQAVYRMVGLGVGAADGPRGDQLVTIEIEYPEVIGDDLRETLLELEAHLGEEVFPRTRRFDAHDDGGDGDGVCSDK